MSGRRSSSAEGRPGGTTGTVGRERRRRDRELGRRLADQHGDRVLERGALDADVDRLRLRALELGLAVITSVSAATPALYWLRVISSDLLVGGDGRRRARASARRRCAARNNRWPASPAPRAAPRRDRRRSPGRWRRRSRRCGGCGPRYRAPSSPSARRRTEFCDRRCRRRRGRWCRTCRAARSSAVAEPVAATVGK